MSLFVSATIQLRVRDGGGEREREMTRGVGTEYLGGHSGILKTAGVCVYVLRPWD